MRGNKNNFFWILGFLSLLATVIFIIVLAHLDLIPSIVKKFPHSDYYLHFLLYGLLGLCFHKALNHKAVFLFKIALPLAFLILAFFTTLEEFSQLFSQNRTFDLVDLFLSLCGIFSFIFVHDLILFSFKPKLIKP
ncbi:MAG: VanZ family protein [Candidatus Moranbacteria bacterium]|nr:VanZ family protein [Candidatus Moranbacteria bacterium]